MLLENLKTIKGAKLDIELLRRKNELLCADNNNDIEKFKYIIEENEKELERELKESGEKKLECKLGYASFRSMPDKWEYGEQAISDIKAIYHETVKRYIKVTETLIKTNIKEDILIGKMGLPSVKVTPQEPKFGYKIK